MILLVAPGNRGPYATDIISMHRQRKAVFVDRARWKVPVVADQEIDRYDLLEHTVYLLAKDEPRGPVLASVRLLTTTGPHLMQDLYSVSQRATIPSGPGVWEASRFCTSPRIACRTRRLSLLGEIICGVMETAMARGIEQVIFAANRALLPLALNCGWEASIVAPTQKDGDDEFTAVVASMTVHGLRSVRDRCGIPAPIIRPMEGRPGSAVAPARPTLSPVEQAGAP